MNHSTQLAGAVLTASWGLLVDAAPFLVFGFLLAGLIRSFVPLDLVRRYLGARGIGTTFKAALVGVPLPLCSCSVLPTAMALKKQGADKSAVSSFLVSTPETGVDSIAISYALLDPIMTLFRPVGAFVAAVAAGGLELLWGKEETPVDPPEAKGERCERGCCGCDTGEENRSLGDRLGEGFRFAFVDLIDDLTGWMIGGLLIAGGMITLLPEDLFGQVTGGDWLMMPLMLVAGVPLYICATSSTPLAAALIVKGISPGAALVFLLAGPATNIGTIMALRAGMGTRSTILYLVAISGSALLLGVALNGLYELLDVDPQATVGAAAELFPPSISIASALLFLGLTLASFVRRSRPRR